MSGTARIYVANLEPFFAKDDETRRWLRDVWQPEESAHGRQTREYVLRTWLAFEWARGYARFLGAYAARCDHEPLRPSPALEALARCVTESRRVFERCDARERNSTLRKARTLVRSALVRDSLERGAQTMAEHFEEAQGMPFRPLRRGRWFDRRLARVSAGSCAAYDRAA